VLCAAAEQQKSILRFFIVLIFALLAIDVRGVPRAEAQPCRGSAADIQALRDNLEIIRNEVRAARNETGNEKEPATDAVVAAIRVLEEAVGHAIAPSPDSKLITLPRGTKHPHMQVIQQAWAAAQRAFDNARCALAGSIEPLRKAMADLDRSLQFR
jgi:hypothetical protein